MAPSNVGCSLRAAAEFAALVASAQGWLARRATATGVGAFRQGGSGVAGLPDAPCSSGQHGPPSHPPASDELHTAWALHAPHAPASWLRVSHPTGHSPQPPHAELGLPPPWHPAAAGTGGATAPAHPRHAARHPPTVDAPAAHREPHGAGGPSRGDVLATSPGVMQSGTGLGPGCGNSTSPEAAGAARSHLASLLLAMSARPRSSLHNSNLTNRLYATAPADWVSGGTRGPAGAPARTPPGCWARVWSRRHYAAASTAAAHALNAVPDPDPEAARPPPGGEGQGDGGGGAGGGTTNGAALSAAEAEGQGRVAAAGGPAAPGLGFVSGGYDVSQFPPERIRNFSIIAHVDHGACRAVCIAVM